MKPPVKHGIITLLAQILLFGCTPIIDFELPDAEMPDSAISANTDIRGLISQYDQSEEEMHTFPEGSTSLVEGVVASSDEAGNFYKTLVVQDVDDTDGRGMLLMIDLRASYTRYELGRRVFLRVEGLSMYRDHGGYRMGYLHRGRLDPIPEPLLDKFIVRSGIIEKPVPRIVETGVLDEDKLNTRIRIEKVQFEREDLGKTYAGEPHDAYNALRPLLICGGEAPISLSTSIYADFKSEILPGTTFDVTGVLSREYDGPMVLVINSPEDLHVSPERSCEREYYNCAPNLEGSRADSGQDIPIDAIFYEDFETIGSTRAIEEAGWMNVNKHYGMGKFVKRTSNDNGFVRISSYGTQEAVVDAWLISPPIDLSASHGEVLSFDTRATFNKGRLLTLWFTHEVEADPRKARWNQIEARISEGSADGSNEKFMTSGDISLECIEGSIRIAFRYLGGDPYPSTNYDLDNVLILGSIDP